MTTRADDRQQELAQTVQVRKQVLLAMVPKHLHAPRKRPGEEALTFEDAAMELAQDDADVARALHRYQEAVNVLWTLALDQGIPEQLAREWLKKQGGPLVERVDVESEIVYQLRAVITRFKPTGTPLGVFARASIFEKLNIWRGQSTSPVTLPSQKTARSAGPFDHHKDIGSASEEVIGSFDNELHNYWDERGYLYEGEEDDYDA